MSGDFSRKTFIPQKHYSGVLMQQGRVQLDADWNEQLAIHQHRTETEALDVIGTCGVPQATNGFKIGQTPDSTDLTISPGRIYVDGLLVELEATPVSILDFVQNNPTQAVLQTVIVDGRPLQAGQWVEIWADDKPTKILFQIVDVDPEQSILTLQDDITAYESSTAPKLRRATTYMTQPDYPNPVPLSLLTSPPTSPPSTGAFVVFLDVWQRHITVHNDPHIREVALGGPDTTTRVQNVWQVHLLPVSTETTNPPTSPPSGEVTCHTPFAEWDQHTAPSTGTLNARTITAEDPKNPCLLPPSSGYRRLENQLYRVEVHTGGSRDEATFKWSRDNASVETIIVLIDGDQVTVTDIGKDDVLGFAVGQWVEIVDDESELKGTPHPLLQIEKVNPATREITMQQSVPALQSATHLKLRRWDQTGPAATTGGVKVVPGWIDLEDGVQVLFSEGQYHPGDYWLIPARTATGEIEWPPFEIPNRHPIPQPPLGIRHHHCRLALLEVQDGILSLMDCRMPFPPLTELTSFCYVGGGGQEAMPGERLPCPLQVAVMNGQEPVVGARVYFAITAGGGGILHAGSQSDIALTVNTDVNGVAQCDWQLGSGEGDEGRRCLQVEARRIDAAGELADPPILFNANLSIASQVAYDPSRCRDLTAAGVRTVQDAIDQLCQQTPAREPGIGIKTILIIANGAELLNDVFVPVSRLAQGLRISCDAPLGQESFGGAPSDPPSIFPQTVPAKPTCFITLDLPYPLGSDRNFWDFSQIVGFQPLILGSLVSVRENEIDWVPTPAANTWLQEILFARLAGQQIADRVLAHLTLKGNFIWRREQDRDPEVYLDGEAFGRPGTRGRVDLRLPSGDGRRGGDFEMWFWLGPSSVSAPDIDVTPTSLAFGNVVVGQSPTQSLTMRNTGNAPLTVAGFTSNNPRFSVVAPAVPLTVAPNGQQPVTVRFSPTTAGPQTGVLSIASNDPDEPTVPIQLQGLGIAPDINVVPTSLDFGSVIRGQSRDLTLTVSNIGSTVLTVTGITINNSSQGGTAQNMPPAYIGGLTLIRSA